DERALRRSKGEHDAPRDGGPCGVPRKLCSDHMVEDAGGRCAQDGNQEVLTLHIEPGGTRCAQIPEPEGAVMQALDTRVDSSLPIDDGPARDRLVSCAVQRELRLGS